MRRLTDSCLNDLPSQVARPRYDRSSVPSRIVHLGVGAFHRSHQAVYTDQLMQDGGPLWGIVGASLRSPRTAQALQPQNGLYSVLTRDNATTSARVIGSLNAVLSLSDSRQILQNKLSSPLTEIVSLTITEKGYFYLPADAALDEASAEIQADLAQPWHPRTAIGLLALAVYDRKMRSAKPFTLLSCDDLPSNGKILQRVVARYIELAQCAFNDRDLQRHFLDQYACPCTVVDRITPVTLPADIEQAQDILGVYDAAPVVAEPFSQWVIQDWFSSRRPAWESAGAILTDHVDAFEQLKLRLLNGSHSAIAYLGSLAGYSTVAQAMQDSELAAFVSALIDDAVATLHMPRSMNVHDYKKCLLKRLTDRALSYRTADIAMDGSQKLPPRILEPIRVRLEQGWAIDRHAIVVAAWIHYLGGRNERGEKYDVVDPRLLRLTQALQKAGAAPRDQVAAMTGFSEIFGRGLPRNPVFINSVALALESLQARGAMTTVAAAQKHESAGAVSS